MADEIALGQKASLQVRRTRAMRFARRMRPHIVSACAAGAWTSTVALARWLNEQGHKTVRGNPWSDKAVAALLRIDEAMRASAELEYGRLRDDLEKRIRRSDDEEEARRRLADTFAHLEAQYRAKLKEADDFWLVLEDFGPPNGLAAGKTSGRPQRGPSDTAAAQ